MSQRTQRRKVIKSIVGVGTIGIAGCTSGGNNSSGGKTTIVIGSTGGGSSISATQSLQRVVSENSDIVEISTTKTGGDPNSIRLYNKGEIDAFTTANNQIRNAIHSKGAFKNENLKMPNQGFTFMRRDDYFVARKDTNIETVEDMYGKNNWLLPPSWGSRALLEKIFSNKPKLKKKMFENVVNIDTSDLAGALEEGRVDAFNAYGTNSRELPSWLGEVDARTDCKYIKLTDPFRELFKKGPTKYYEDLEVFGWEQDLGTDTVSGHRNPLNYYFSPEIPQKAINEFLKITQNHYKSAREGFPAFFNYEENPEEYTTGIAKDLAPVHPGAVQFYKDNDIWNDDWPTQ